MGHFFYDESTLQHWVAAHVSRGASLDEVPVCHLRELRQRYREEIDSIPAQDVLIAALGDNSTYTVEMADVDEVKNAIRYCLGLWC